MLEQTLHAGSCKRRRSCMSLRLRSSILLHMQLKKQLSLCRIQNHLIFFHNFLFSLFPFDLSLYLYRSWKVYLQRTKDVLDIAAKATFFVYDSAFVLGITGTGKKLRLKWEPKMAPSCLQFNIMAFAVWYLNGTGKKLGLKWEAKMARTRFQFNIMIYAVWLARTMLLYVVILCDMVSCYYISIYSSKYQWQYSGHSFFINMGLFVRLSFTNLLKTHGKLI